MKSKITSILLKFKNLSIKKKILIVAVAIIVLLFILINSSKKDDGIYTDEVAKTQDINTFYSFSGNIDSNDKQNIVSKTSLSVKEFHVEEGDFVNEGDLLFELDDSSISSNLEQTKANVELAKINLDAAKGPNKSQQLSQAKLNLTTAQINYDTAIGSSKEQQIIQIRNAHKSAQSTYDTALQNFERVQGLYKMGGSSLVEVEQSQASLEQAEIQLEIAQNNFDNMGTSLDQSINLAKEQLNASQSAYDTLQQSLNNNIRIAEEQLKQAEASYDLVQQQADDSRVLAEVSGEVSEIYVSENESIVMGTPIMDIFNFDDLIVKIKVDEYDLKAITLDKDAKVLINALDETVTGKITDISRLATVVNDVSFFEATVSLEENEYLRVGLSTELTIPNESVKDTTTISMKAIQFDNENKPYVYYRDIKGNVATKEVTIGINDGITVEILDGVESGETVLVPVTYPNYMVM